MSNDLFEKARRYIPGGVNSPVRAFRSVGGDPVFFERGQGPYLYATDGREYIDYVGSWGPMILGHACADVIERVIAAVKNGLSFGAPTEIEIAMAEKICHLVPGIEKVRMVNSGTEAAMSAIRLARGVTGRDTLVKFEGGYHGHADSLLVAAGSGALTFGTPDSAGVPEDFARHTLTLRYNDLEQAQQLFAERGQDIAAVIVEPVAGNMNCIPPVPDFLQGLRELTGEHGSLLIFDEVMTGFRVALAGAQSLYGINPDLTILGKVIGGGMPVGAFGGQAKIMDAIAPDGPVYQAGTLSGNPVAMTAGLATLEKICEPGFYERLGETTSNLLEGMQAAADEAGIAFTTNQVGGMFGLFFSAEETIRYYSQVTACDIEAFKQFFHGMLDAGVYLAPSAFEAGFVSAAHGSKEIDRTIEAARKAFKRIKV